MFSNVIFIALSIYFIYSGAKQLSSGFADKEKEKLEAKYTKESIDKYAKVSGVTMIVIAIIQIAITAISFLIKESTYIQWILLAIIIAFAIALVIIQKVICKEKDTVYEEHQKEKEIDEDLENSDQ